jgi:hypothetical protein
VDIRPFRLGLDSVFSCSVRSQGCNLVAHGFGGVPPARRPSRAVVQQGGKVDEPGPAGIAQVSALRHALAQGGGHHPRGRCDCSGRASRAA